jgi:methanogen homoaconitase large subunit
MATLSERILGGPAGSYVDRSVDRAFVHDGTGVLTLEAFQRMGDGNVTAPDRTYLLFDHIAPANNSETANLQAELRRFAYKQGLRFSDIGGGICHQLMAEGEVLPGEVVIGADSHSCTLGAFGAFATGVGATDMAGIWAEGGTWFRVPSSIEIRLDGRMEGSVEAKDAALAYVGLLGMDGANYRALEFTGSGVPGLTMDDRLTLSNLAIECGAKTGLFYADQITIEYLAGMGRSALPQQPEECRYEKTVGIDLSALEPLAAIPPRVDRSRPVSELAGLPVDQVFVGTCTNGRYSDLARFAAAIRGKKVKIRTIVVPASRRVMVQAARSGIIAELNEAGCIVGAPGCGPCLGAHMGVIGKGEVCVSTANRNFRNRMGVGGEVYLASVGTAAATALRGEITPPEVPDAR